MGNPLSVANEYEHWHTKPLHRISIGPSNGDDLFESASDFWNRMVDFCIHIQKLDDSQMFTARVAKRAKVMFSQACVTHSVQLGGGGLVGGGGWSGWGSWSGRGGGGGLAVGGGGGGGSGDLPSPRIGHWPPPPPRIGLIRVLWSMRRRYEYYWNAYLLL